MKTKYILYFYAAVLFGYCGAEFFQNYYRAYFILTVICLAIFIAADYASCRLGHSIISIEKREHTQKRESGGDVARALAVILVPTLHCFGLINYYDTQFSYNMLIPTMIRWIAVCAVPMFMIISGYFKVNSEFSAKHYKGLIPLLMTHFFISAVRIFVDAHYFDAFVDAQYVIDRMVFFKYGWYIQLYIGMLILMPIFNIAYKKAESRRNKELMILSIVGITALGPLSNNIIPSTWVMFYVFGFYLIGCYLSEYKVKINPIINIAMVLLVVFVVSLSDCKHCLNTVFDWDFIGYSFNSGYSSMAAVIIAGLIMSLCFNIKIELKPVCFLLKTVSVVSLEIYLFSQMYDGFIYKDINGVVDFWQVYPDMPKFVAMSFLLAYVTAWVKKLVFFVFKKLIFQK